MYLCKATRSWRCCFLAIAGLTLFMTVQAAEVKNLSGSALANGDEVFTNGPLRRLEIKIAEKEMAVLRKYRWGGWGGAQQERESVRCTVEEGGRVYTNVAVHLKGAAGSFRPVDDRPALTLNFAKNAKGQTFHGLQRISLNNSVQDSSYLSEQISREMYSRAGVPVPRATQVQLKLNGRELGIYVLTEAFNKQFLKHHFADPNGNLYDGGFLKDVGDDLEKSSGKNPRDRSDLKRLAEAAKDPNPTNRFVQLGKVLDLDRFITLLALDSLLCNWDGYGINKNNYRIYHDPRSGLFVFMPHGLDQMFGVMRTGPDMPIFPRMSGLVARAVLQTPQGLERYRQQLATLMKDVYEVSALTNRVWQLAGRVRATISTTEPTVVKSYDREVAELSERIALRADNVQQQLGASGKSTMFGSDGTARLTEWKARAEFGKPVLEQTKDANGNKVLHVAARQGSSVGSWSTKVNLPPGVYRLEGRVKSQGVIADAGDRKGGAWLRTADRRVAQKVVSNDTWAKVGMDLKIEQNLESKGFMGRIESVNPEVEILCELRASKGEAWFDLDSLRLTKKE